MPTGGNSTSSKPADPGLATPPPEVRTGRAGGHRGCLSCGQVEGMSRRRYCSVACRQHLRMKLNQRTGLLKALNARYATFYFTDAVIVMDLLTGREDRIYSFIYPRSPQKAPADDYSTMANALGTAWWATHDATGKRYLAARDVLAQAADATVSAESVRPRELHLPRFSGKALMHLQLKPRDLTRPESEQLIKQAYRRQALRHHPDHGGSARGFRRVRNAYEELLDWLQEPSFIRRRGFPDKWFYDARRNAWIQPTPAERSG